MRSSHSLDRLDTAFDDDRLVADAGSHGPQEVTMHIQIKARLTGNGFAEEDHQVGGDR